MKKSIFSDFEKLSIANNHTIVGGKEDTGTTTYIETTYGLSGLDAYNDPQYNDVVHGDWDDRDAC